MNTDQKRLDEYIGARLQQARATIGWDRPRLADELDVAIADLAAYEAGIERLPARTITRAAAKLGKSVDWFFRGGPEVKPSEEVASIGDDLARFLSIPESIPMMRAFAAVPDADARMRIVEYAVSAGHPGRRH